MTPDEIVNAVFGDSDNAAAAVDHVFSVLAATYPATWQRSLGTAPIGMVKTVWGYQLSHFMNSKASKRRIVWALQNPLDSVPDAVKFRNHCRAAPSTEKEVFALPAPTNPAVVAAIVSGLKGAAVVCGMKDWAHRLKKRHEAGEALNLNQVRCYQQALGAAV
jgi:hypothetical protein